MASKQAKDLTKSEETVKEEEKEKVLDIISDDIISKRVVKALQNTTLAQKRVGEKPVKARNIVRNMMKWIIYFNAQPENTVIIMDHPISDWYILDDFKDFILPNSVRYENGNRIFDDLLVRPKVPEMDPYDDYNTYLDVLEDFRRLFKGNAFEGRVTLDTLRINRSFEDVKPIAAYEVGDKLMCRYLDVRFIPIHLEGVKPLLGSDYVNENTDRIILDYIAEMRFW